MSVAFYRGQQMGREDLNIYLTNHNGIPANAAEITYSLHDVTTGQEALVGSPRRNPANPSVGEYYASVVIPLDANLGLYRIRWVFREMVGSPIQQVVQEFEVIDKLVQVPGQASFTTCDTAMMRSLRLMLRDKNPDRNAKFRPPAHEETIQQFNQVFGFLWEDEELKEFLDRSVDMVSLYPPMTPFGSLDNICSQYPAWKTVVLTGAMILSLQAMQIHWISEEFSVSGDTRVTVYHDGICRDLPIEHLHQVCYGPVVNLGYHDVETRLAFRQARLKVKSVLTESGDVGYARVRDVMQHHLPDRNQATITLTDGRSVSATMDHSLFVWKDGKIVAADALEIQDGMDLVCVEEGHVTACTVADVHLHFPGTHGVMLYDLSVPGPENFVLTNGILAHNSYSIGGVSLDLERSSKYDSARSAAEQQFASQIEKGKATVNYIRGLKQPRFGTGIRSSFGPFTGAGVLVPSKYLGF